MMRIASSISTAWRESAIPPLGLIRNGKDQPLPKKSRSFNYLSSRFTILLAIARLITLCELIEVEHTSLDIDNGRGVYVDARRSRNLHFASIRFQVNVLGSLHGHFGGISLYRYIAGGRFDGYVSLALDLGLVFGGVYLYVVVLSLVNDRNSFRCYRCIYNYYLVPYSTSDHPAHHLPA